jgi:hypothetical protein
MTKLPPRKDLFSNTNTRSDAWKHMKLWIEPDKVHCFQFHVTEARKLAMQSACFAMRSTNAACSHILKVVQQHR